MPDISKIKYWRKRARRAERSLIVTEYNYTFVISFLKRYHPAIYAAMRTFYKNQKRIKRRLIKQAM